jgi:hypothetical protein
MKKNALRLSLTLLLTLSLLTACGSTVSNNDAPKPYGYADDLIGCWVQEPDEDGNLAVYQFFSNGTFMVMFESENTWSGWEKDDGTWYTEKDGTFVIDNSVSSYRIVNKNLVEFSRQGETTQMKRYDKNLSEIGKDMPRPDVWNEG